MVRVKSLKKMHLHFENVVCCKFLLALSEVRVKSLKQAHLHFEN